MKPILLATALLSGSSIVSISVGLVSAKAWAILLGPGGLGYMGLLQSLVGLAGLLTGAGLGTGIVRIGAGLVAGDDAAGIAAFRRAAWLLCWGLGGLATLSLVVFRFPVAEVMLGEAQHADAVILMAVALLFNLASGVQTGLLNAHHRVKALAKIGVVTALLSTSVSLVVVWLWRVQGIAPGIILGAFASWLVSYVFLRREIPSPRIRPRTAETRSAALALLRFGLPYTASMLVGTGVQFLLPALVLHNLGAEDVGYYRAAVAVSVTYLGFLLTAMGMDYYPRVSAVRDQPSTLGTLVNQQQRLVLLLGGPMILGMLAVAPPLVPLIYSPEFTPAVAVLEWQLIGDLFRFSSWTMGFIIVARSSSRTVFLVEVIAGLSMVSLTWLGIQVFGLAGTGLGFLGSYFVHFLVVWLVTRQSIGLVWTRSNQALLVLALVAAFAIHFLSLLGLESARLPIALLIALVAGAGSAFLIWRELGGLKSVRVEA